MLALAPGADEDAALTSLALRLRRAGALGPAQFLGVGAAAGSVGELRSAFGWAADAASAAAVSPPKPRAGRPPYLRLEDLGIAGLAFQLRDDPRAAAFAEHQLGPLLRHDAAHGTGLAELLAAYLSSGNKAATAARCGIARPTLYERLHLIEQLLGVRLDDGGTRTALDAALFMHRAQVSDQRYAPPRQAR
jgi:PucR family transcriptional regulator, purine catabolism regulatory protein